MKTDPHNQNAAQAWLCPMLTAAVLILGTAASNAQGVTRIDNGNGTATITLQPGPGANNGTDTGGPDDGKDAWVQYHNGSYGSGNNPINWTVWPSNFAANGYGYYLFNIAAVLNPGEVIVSAELRMTHLFRASYSPNWAAGAEAFRIESAAAPWDEMNLQWSNQPSTNNLFSYGVTVNPNPLTPGGDPLGATWGRVATSNVDITPMVQAWHNGSLPNNGFLFRMADQGFYNGQDHYIFTSDTVRPDLVQYRPALSIIVNQAGPDPCEIRIAELEGLLSERDDMIDDLQDDVSSLSGQVASLNGQVSDLLLQLAAKDTEIAGLNGQIDGLTAENNRLAAENASYLADLSQAADALREITSLLATPPGKRASDSDYGGSLGNDLNRIIEMLLAPPGSNINSPKAKK